MSIQVVCNVGGRNRRVWKLLFHGSWHCS